MCEQDAAERTFFLSEAPGAAAGAAGPTSRGSALPPKGRCSLCPELLAEQEGAQRGLQPWDEGYLAEYAMAEELPAPSPQQVPKEGQ